MYTIDQTHTITITVRHHIVNREDLDEFRQGLDGYDLIDCIREGLPKEWFSTDDGDDFAILSFDLVKTHGPRRTVQFSPELEASIPLLMDDAVGQGGPMVRPSLAVQTDEELRRDIRKRLVTGNTHKDMEFHYAP